MSDFLTYSDYTTRLNVRVIELLTSNSNSALISATAEAVGLITDRLSDKYAITAELAKTSSARNTSLVRYALGIAVYSLYSRVPDEEIPERVIKDYDDTMRDLELLQRGKLTSTLALNTDSSGETISSIRIGSNSPRSHDPFQYP